eukprot:CAMPEP_0183300134 /NCGR_PEP_ID=MMETSP0160_2-20130417/6663_1 /TAXON_ID=2839 ORGANISM="Odontella Sinensis, Strain Grunow 1884" /NCGR_SAMPLE_ID=MMETSP0160_2 /ASSEMBLY_ACC=CAM_ASM_000250 /LENGTH=252 /DNA_ID=CAMNT_0025462501 /DNA_START=46 /DNA_END=801 /DNA_ORIENTATION=-
MITSFFSPKEPKGRQSSEPASDRKRCRDRAEPEEVTPSPAAASSSAASSSSSSELSPHKRSKPSPSPGLGLGLGARSPCRKLRPEAEELMSHLKDDRWREALMQHASSPKFARLAEFVKSERARGKTVYPPPEDVFSALNLTPLDSVRVVLVGQDPYHGPNQGHGLAFSVRKGVAIPPSLRNIYKELANDPDIDFAGKPTHGYLERWARQGVLMLNSVLTVRRGEANSHAKKGWEDFTDEVVRILHRQSQSE